MLVLTWKRCVRQKVLRGWKVEIDASGRWKARGLKWKLDGLWWVPNQHEAVPSSDLTRSKQGKEGFGKPVEAVGRVV
jgi:hypothetical protein